MPAGDNLAAVVRLSHTVSCWLLVFWIVRCSLRSQTKNITQRFLAGRGTFRQGRVLCPPSTSRGMAARGCGLVWVGCVGLFLVCFMKVARAPRHARPTTSSTTVVLIYLLLSCMQLDRASSTTHKHARPSSPVSHPRNIDSGFDEEDLSWVCRCPRSVASE